MRVQWLRRKLAVVLASAATLGGLTAGGSAATARGDEFGPIYWGHRIRAHHGAVHGGHSWWRHGRGWHRQPLYPGGAYRLGHHGQHELGHHGRRIFHVPRYHHRLHRSPHHGFVVPHHRYGHHGVGFSVWGYWGH